MQYCPKCKVHIHGNKTCCPLCQGIITGTPEDPVFPPQEASRANAISLARIATFAFLLVEIIMGVLFYLFPLARDGALLVAFIALCAWIDVAIARYYRNNVMGLVTIQTYVVMLVCYFVDMNTGGYDGWSIQWVIPILFLVLELTTFLIGYFSQLHMVDYVIYLAFDTILATFQLHSVRTGANTFPIPAIICVILLLGWAAFILVFRGKDLKNAVTKYLNR